MKRTFLRATLLYGAVFFFSVWNALRLHTALAWRGALSEFGASPPPFVAAVSGGAWALAGLWLLWKLWRDAARGAIFLFLMAAAFSLWYWVERLVWQSPHPNWLFAVIVNLAAIFFVLFQAKSLAREAHEQNIENRTFD
jgi:uncharacterized membrane protein